MNTSRNLLLAGSAAIALSAMASQAFAQASATTSATASVTIFQPITITKASDLIFGRVIRSSTATATVFTVSETADNTSSKSGGDGIFTGATTPTRAKFTVHGEGAQVFGITVPASVDMSGTTATLTASATTGTLDGTLGSTGTATFGVGGSITLDNTAATGSKSGSFNVTVTYN